MAASWNQWQNQDPNQQTEAPTPLSYQPNHVPQGAEVNTRQQSELEAQHNWIRQAEQQYHAMTERLQALEGELRAKDALIVEATAEAQYWKEQGQLLQDAKADDEARYGHQIKQVEERCRGLTLTAEAKESEIWALKGLLSTQSESSDTEIADALEGINGRIAQLAMQHNCRWLKPLKDDIPVNSADPVPAVFAEALGCDFLQLLNDNSAEATYAMHTLQFAWQAILCRAALWAIQGYQISDRITTAPRHHPVNRVSAEIERSGELDLRERPGLVGGTDEALISREPAHLRSLARNNISPLSQHGNGGCENEEPGRRSQTGHRLLSPRPRASPEGVLSRSESLRGHTIQASSRDTGGSHQTRPDDPRRRYQQEL